MSLPACIVQEKFPNGPVFIHSFTHVFHIAWEQYNNVSFWNAFGLLIFGYETVSFWLHGCWNMFEMSRFLTTGPPLASTGGWQFLYMTHASILMPHALFLGLISGWMYRMYICGSTITTFTKRYAGAVDALLLLATTVRFNHYYFNILRTSGMRVVIFAWLVS